MVAGRFDIHDSGTGFWVSQKPLLGSRRFSASRSAGAGSRVEAVVARVQASVWNMLSPTLPSLQRKSATVHVNPGILGAYPWPLRVHCKGLVEVAPEQFTDCSCMHYTTRRSV